MALDSEVVIESRTQLGARLTLAEIALGDETVAEVSAWGKNLLDSDEIEFARDLSNGTVVGTFEVPRTYGLDFVVNF